MYRRRGVTVRSNSVDMEADCSVIAPPSKTTNAVHSCGNGTALNGVGTTTAASSSALPNGSLSQSKHRRGFHPVRYLRILLRSKRSGEAWAVWMLLLLISIGMLQRGRQRQRFSMGHRRTEEEVEQLLVSFSYGMRNDVRPFFVLWTTDEEKPDPSYEGLEFYSLEGVSLFSRRIDPYDRENYEAYRSGGLSAMDDPYLEPQYEPDEDLLDRKSYCRRNNWMNKKFPTCNTIHELSLGRSQLQVVQDYDVRYLGYGTRSLLCLRFAGMLLARLSLLKKLLCCSEVTRISPWSFLLYYVPSTEKKLQKWVFPRCLFIPISHFRIRLQAITIN